MPLLKEDAWYKHSFDGCIGAVADKATNYAKINTDHLPNEILELIFSCLELDHIKIVRLVCRRFEQCLTKFLLDTVYIGFRGPVLDRLDEIACKSELRASITTVVFATIPEIW